MGFPLYIICHFSCIAFNIFSLSLIFVSLITMYLGVLLLGFILSGPLCASWTLLTISFPTLRKFSAIISSNIFSAPFSLSSLSDPYNANVAVFDVIPEVSEAVFISFNSFYIFCSIHILINIFVGCAL